MRRPKLIIVDNNLTFRQRLIFLINVEKSFEVIGVASKEDELIKLLSNQQPDFMLMDVDIPRLKAIGHIQEALKKLPDLKIYAFTLFEDDDYIINLIRAGIKGFVLKSSAIYELDKDIHSLLTIANYCVDNQVINTLKKDIVFKSHISKEHKRISNRTRRFSN